MATKKNPAKAGVPQQKQRFLTLRSALVLDYHETGGTVPCAIGMELRVLPGTGELRVRLIGENGCGELTMTPDHAARVATELGDQLRQARVVQQELAAQKKRRDARAKRLI